MSPPARVRVGIDIGGTFTDVVVMDPSSGSTSIHKVLSTPSDSSTGVLQGLETAGLTDQVDFLVHGTTVGLNALLSRSGPRVALVTTAGFRDVLHLGRAENRRMWELRSSKPARLVPLEDIHTVRERMLHDGSVERALVETDVAPIAERIAAAGIESVAVCLLHAHVNPAHELRVRELLTTALPGLSVALSHEVAPEAGEYERTSTTVVSAYVGRPVERYLTSLIGRFHDVGHRVPLHVMRSSGGISSAQVALRQPIQTLLSGPAGGVVGAEALAGALKRPNLIAIDMGGTSLDASLVVDGRLTWLSESELAEQAIRLPVVELHTIGAGGGSIAHVESGGLRVGPGSAGSAPGPACYGLGGDRATVTDAQVVLGRIDPTWFLGGRMPLDVAAAEGAVGRVAGELGLHLRAAAEGIVAVANAKMADALRTLTVRRGIDPRDFSLLVFGGAGPLHGAELAAELGISEAIVPFAPGVFSAWGMLHAQIRHDVSAPLGGTLGDPAADERLGALIAQLRERGEALLAEEQVPEPDRAYLAFADMRYEGQEHSISVSLSDLPTLATRFHAEYRARYGHAMPDAPVEYVNVRLAALGHVGAVPSDRPVEAERDEHARETTTEVHVGGSAHTARVLQRDGVGDRVVSGAAIVLEGGSTTFVPPGWQVRRGALGALFLTEVDR